jgi:hypothetical protein
MSRHTADAVIQPLNAQHAAVTTAVVVPVKMHCVTSLCASHVSVGTAYFVVNIQTTCINAMTVLNIIQKNQKIGMLATMNIVIKGLCFALSVEMIE